MIANQKTADQLKVDAFLQEFVAELTKAYGNEIDFILLFGSAARGEFILGKSDVDLIIQVKSDSAVKTVEAFAERLFWRLDEKYGMQFRQVVSTGAGQGIMEDALKFLEKQARLYKPFEVFGPNDIDWGRGKIKRLDLLPGATLVASQLTLLYKMKHEGMILYGRGILPEIQPRFTAWEKIKALWVPQGVAFAAVVLAPLLPKKAVGYAVKALFYELDSVNLFLKSEIPPDGAKIEGFASATEFKEKLLDDVRFYLELKLGLLSEQKREFVMEAARIKRNGFEDGSGRWAALRFSLRAFGVIWETNTAAILKAGASL
ncbi:MAG TPA: nucleotidyltransferase domain-containing protein [Methanotrichaceae archaeon]|nr:nucleotidyltransferase domain-containing protein [Methanotrichaceae archaeon]